MREATVSVSTGSGKRHHEPFFVRITTGPGLSCDRPSRCGDSWTRAARPPSLYHCHPVPGQAMLSLTEQNGEQSVKRTGNPGQGGKPGSRGPGFRERGLTRGKHSQAREGNGAASRIPTMRVMCQNRPSSSSPRGRVVPSASFLLTEISPGGGGQRKGGGA